MTESRKDVLRALGVYAVAVLIYLAGTGETIRTTAWSGETPPGCGATARGTLLVWGRPT